MENGIDLWTCMEEASCKFAGRCLRPESPPIELGTIPEAVEATNHVSIFDVLSGNNTHAREGKKKFWLLVAREAMTFVPSFLGRICLITLQFDIHAGLVFRPCLSDYIAVLVYIR